MGTILKIATALQSTVAGRMGERPLLENDAAFEGLYPDEITLIQDIVASTGRDKNIFGKPCI